MVIIVLKSILKSTVSSLALLSFLSSLTPSFAMDGKDDEQKQSNNIQKILQPFKQQKLDNLTQGKNQQNKINVISIEGIQVPEEIFMLILLRLNGQDLLNTQKVCKSWKSVNTALQIWRLENWTKERDSHNPAQLLAYNIPPFPYAFNILASRHIPTDLLAQFPEAVNAWGLFSTSACNQQAYQSILTNSLSFLNSELIQEFGSAVKKKPKEEKDVIYSFLTRWALNHLNLLDVPSTVLIATFLKELPESRRLLVRAIDTLQVNWDKPNWELVEGSNEYHRFFQAVRALALLGLSTNGETQATYILSYLNQIKYLSVSYPTDFKENNINSDILNRLSGYIRSTLFALTSQDKRYYLRQLFEDYAYLNDQEGIYEKLKSMSMEEMGFLLSSPEENAEWSSPIEHLISQQNLSLVEAILAEAEKRAPNRPLYRELKLKVLEQIVWKEEKSVEEQQKLMDFFKEAPMDFWNEDLSSYNGNTKPSYLLYILSTLEGNQEELASIIQKLNNDNLQYLVSCIGGTEDTLLSRLTLQEAEERFKDDTFLPLVKLKKAQFILGVQDKAKFSEAENLLKDVLKSMEGMEWSDSDEDEDEDEDEDDSMNTEEDSINEISSSTNSSTEKAWDKYDYGDALYARAALYIFQGKFQEAKEDLKIPSKGEGHVILPAFKSQLENSELPAELIQLAGEGIYPEIFKNNYERPFPSYSIMEEIEENNWFFEAAIEKGLLTREIFEERKKKIQTAVEASLSDEDAPEEFEFEEKSPHKDKEKEED